MNYRQILSILCEVISPKESDFDNSKNRDPLNFRCKRVKEKIYMGSKNKKIYLNNHGPIYCAYPGNMAGCSISGKITHAEYKNYSLVFLPFTNQTRLTTFLVV